MTDKNARISGERSDNHVANIAVGVLCVVFILAGIVWIDKPGIQTDEALFAAGIFTRPIPLMAMTYVGTLKTHIWSIIFQLWPPSPASVRIPAVLLGALSVWLFYRLVLCTLGRRAAVVAAALLATDPLYILYSRWDHGPVVLLHLCFVGTMLCLVRFHIERRVFYLALGFLLLGLAMWEKAIFAWLVGGLCIAGLAVFWKEMRQSISIRNVRVAALAFVVGAMPLIIFNARNRLVTFRSNTVWSTKDLAHKGLLLKATLQGEALFGAMMRETWDGPLLAPDTQVQKAVVAVSLAAGSPRRNLMFYLALLAFPLLALTWRTPARRAFLFALVCFAVTWLQMAFVQNAGTGAHHTILLWPLPALAIGAVLAGVSERMRFGRIVLGVVTVLACTANLLVLSTYYTNLIRNGGTDSWTDAMYPALAAIHNMDKEAVCTVDWGFSDTVHLFEGGRTPRCDAVDPVDPERQQVALRQIQEPGYVFLSHTQGHESFPGMTMRLVQFAESRGYRRVNHQLFADRNGRQTVETFRFEIAGELGK